MVLVPICQTILEICELESRITRSNNYEILYNPLFRTPLRALACQGGSSLLDSNESLILGWFLIFEDLFTLISSDFATWPSLWWFKTYSNTTGLVEKHNGCHQKARSVMNMTPFQRKAWNSWSNRNINNSASDFADIRVSWPDLVVPSLEKCSRVSKNTLECQKQGNTLCMNAGITRFPHMLQNRKSVLIEDELGWRNLRFWRIRMGNPNQNSQKLVFGV